MSKRGVVSWEYVPVLTVRLVDPDWSDPARLPQEFADDELEAMQVNGEWVRQQQRDLCKRFGFEPGYKQFRLTYDG